MKWKTYALICIGAMLCGTGSAIASDQPLEYKFSIRLEEDNQPVISTDISIVGGQGVSVKTVDGFRFNIKTPKNGVSTTAQVVLYDSNDVILHSAKLSSQSDSSWNLGYSVCPEGVVFSNPAPAVLPQCK